MKIALEKIDDFLHQMNSTCIKKYHFERAAFDGLSGMLLYIIMNDSIGKGKDHSRFSRSHLAKLCRTSPKKIRVRLLALARFGLIKVETPWRDDGSGLRDTMMTYPNPILERLLGNDPYTRRKAPVLAHYCDMGIRRLDYDNDVQGFLVDCAYGSKEPQGGEPVKAEKILDDVLSKDDDAKARRERINQTWREYADQFVVGCAEIWVRSQAYLGYGISRPNWEGQTSSLSPSARRERMELVRTFEAYGCKATALGWYIFVGGIADVDKYGKPNFSIFAPHRQFVTIDKKPSQFAKHFNAIIKDDVFLQYAKKDWEQVKQMLDMHFSGILDVGPKNDSEFSKLGFGIGNGKIDTDDIVDKLEF